MWRLSPIRPHHGHELNVPRHADIDAVVKTFCEARGDPYPQGIRDADWHEAQNWARTRVHDNLFGKLRRDREVSIPLAAKLVQFSLSGHLFWQLESGALGPKKVADDPRYFLLGMAVELIGWTPGAVSLMDEVPNWPTGSDATAILARNIWEAQKRPDGQELRHWLLAEWLQNIAQTARSGPNGSHSPSLDLLLEAMGIHIINDPLRAAQRLEAA